METYARLRSVLYDTVTVGTRSSAELFGRIVGDADSVTDADEATAVSAILTNAMLRDVLLDELGVSREAMHACRVTSPFVSPNEKPGGIDVILFDAANPSQAVVMECKRIKAIHDEVGGERVNRLEAFGRAHDQVNALGRLGFHRTFVAAIALVDGRADPTPSFAHRGLSTATFQRLFRIGGEIALDPVVGLLYVEVAQPVNKPASAAATFSVGVLREPSRQEQRSGRTEALVRFMRERT